MRDIYNNEIDCQWIEKFNCWQITISADIAGGMAPLWRATDLKDMYYQIPPKFHWLLTKYFKND